MMDEGKDELGLPPATEASLAQAVEVSALKTHIGRLLWVVLDANPQDVESSLLNHADTWEICHKFITDPQQQVLFIVKEKGEARTNANAGLGSYSDYSSNSFSTFSYNLDYGSLTSPTGYNWRSGVEDSNNHNYNYALQLELSYSDSQVASMALIKRFPIVEEGRPLQNQLQLINLPGPGDGGNTYETLHSYIHNAVSPFFDAYVASKGGLVPSTGGRDDKEAKTGVPMAKKKLAELELSLLHLQQNVEIPDITLMIDPVVKSAVTTCREQKKKVTVDAVGNIDDSSFLNKLQGDVNGWVREIQKVTKLTRDPASGTASQEINFWLSMERALAQIEEQLKSDQITLTLDILKHAKRFHATVSFLADTGIKEAMDNVAKYNQLMRDFPLNELLSATDVDKIRESILQIFGHLNKKLRLSPYPIRRALPLVEAISRDLNEQLLKVLGNRRLMFMDYNEFEKAIAGCDKVFSVWDDQVKEFVNVAREVTRKRSEKFIPLRVNNAHVKLEERVNFLKTFRKQHEQLHSTILKVMKPEKSSIEVSTTIVSIERGVHISDASAIDDVNAAFEGVKKIDVLDITLEGTEVWVAAENAYNDRVSRVENQIIARLRDRLGTAKNANEMFRVFSKFNALFVRPKIRGAIQEYQTQLIDSVKDDIKRLHDKFKAGFRNSEVYRMSQLRDIPAVAGTIIWARQIEHQLGLYMKRVEDVLGKGWENYAEGTKLYEECTAFRRKLDTKPVFDAWLTEIQKRDLSVSGRIFDIVRARAAGNALTLNVSFDSQIITLFKDVRNLLWLNFSIPHAISNVGKDAKRVYQYAVSLSETVRTYGQTVNKVTRNAVIAPLIAVYQKDVQTAISKGIMYRWEMFSGSYDTRPQFTVHYRGADKAENRQVMYVREFAAIVSVFQEKVNTALLIYNEINLAVEELKSCVYLKSKLMEILDRIQRDIDRLNLEAYSNLEEWTEQIDQRIEEVLITRLQSAIKAWTAEFLQEDGSIDARRLHNRLTSEGSLIQQQLEEFMELSTPRKDESRPQMKCLVHELRLKDQVMYLYPPIESARAHWYTELHDWLLVVCSLSRVQGSRYEMGLAVDVEESENTYSNLLTKLPQNTLESAYGILEMKLKLVSDYVGIWLQYQSLWDLEPQLVHSKLGDDLNKWQQLVLEIKKARATFDNSETKRSFGPIVIDYEQVQSKVNAKYDQWQREVLNQFGSKLGNSMREFYTTVSKARYDLEQQSVDSSSTAAAVSFITFVQDLKRKLPKWSVQVETFRNGQKVLERQRFQFPSDWLYVDNVDGEWSALNEILTRKNNAIQEQIAGLQSKIVAEDRIVEQKIKDILAEWEKSKPVQGQIEPDIAMNTLSIFEGRVTRLKEEYDQVCRAKEALDLEQTVNNRLDPVLEELRDLKGVWSSLSAIWQKISELKDTLWSSVMPRKLRQQLDQLLASTKEMPSRMRQYSAFEHVQETIKSHIKTNALLTDLKSEALRERHWKQLFKSLKFDGKLILSELTVGHLWDADMKRNETVIREVITTAQGEMALEEFLKFVKETWTSYSLELINYQNKCRLIRGWDDLFAKCSENLNSLTAMKHSPYYKVFEEEAATWEDRLNRIHVLFDVWIDVQRQWVYLEGIFTGNADIKHLLPVESSRFQNINGEFMAVMKKVYKSPFILDVLNIQNIQKSLERLADLLSKIQKALGEYLERERSSFPRFYFVGDEDLLEIIGNSKDVVRIQKHFKKMFAGISSIILDDEATTILGMASKEGETVQFKSPVSIKSNPRINDWLTLLEKEMRESLALWTSDALQAMNQFYYSENLDGSELLSWMDTHPAQLVVLTMQIVWTQSVEKALAAASETRDTTGLQTSLKLTERSLNVLADLVLTDLHPLRRKKCEHLITELVHQRDLIRKLIQNQVSSASDFDWLYQMRFYWNSSEPDPLKRLTIRMANASFLYGYEYLGVPDRLVQTPLTDRCYLTLTQALDSRLGGSPFGPAGTGKTESVKALGVQLGRFVLVFCCDENFDFQAMGRIFLGLCQVGAWGCFDEFNRLEERILSAVSQQIQTIQIGLKEEGEIELLSKNLKVNPNTGIFITMNPGYAGRSNLPDNLKKLFRSIAMTKPDRELIAQVMLYSQGFRTAELLASKVVPLFNLCDEQLSPQSHYDFGLRSLKSVLISAGNLKRDRLNSLRSLQIEAETSDDAVLKATAASSLESISDSGREQELLIQSIRETVVPKLVAEDIPLLQSLMADVFPGIEYKPVDLGKLQTEIRRICKERRLVDGEFWMEKVIQLYQIQSIHHGLMMVGPSGSGKTLAWQVLLAALEKVEGVEGVSYVIDPKAMSKEALYGSMDVTTREWTDGLFTHTLRKIVDNVRGEHSKRHWIIFDGDVDPEWVENLNSVLDDNKLLTLPNGERLSLPPNVRIMFEVETLKYATLATVSRCGMVWFSEDVITFDMIATNYLETLRQIPLDDTEEESVNRRTANNEDAAVSQSLITQRLIAEIISPYFRPDGLVQRALEAAESLEHIMDFTHMRVLNTLFSLINKTVRNVLEYNAGHPDFPLGHDQMEAYVPKRLVLSIIWSFSGDSKLETRSRLGEFIRTSTTIDLPPTGSGASVIDYDVSLTTGEWIPWQTKVPTIEIETHNVSAADIVIPTIDTVRHEEVLYSWLSEHKPVILCGPPGSGKTMTLFSALRKLSEMEVVGLNFSSATTPELVLKTFEQYCEYRKTPNGVVLSPLMLGRWLVVFCDEINLPATDKYGTQRVISFLRQLVERGGYWRSSDKSWVQLERIQFVGACNPPTDPGRVPMTHRFLRHAPLVMVDYPGEISLLQIYNTFSRAMLKVTPSLRGYAEPLSQAMVEFYLMSQKRFTPDIQAHYIYSPRELTRWVRGIFEAIKPSESLTIEGLVRIWAHEGLRLFQDRLVSEDERQWTDENIDVVALKHFPNINREQSLTRPILFSDWLTKDYLPVEREELREFVKARLKTFYEEELDVPLVLFNDVLEHVLRIDRVFRQKQGHLLLIGVSGSGKTTLSRFVAWIKGLSVFQIKVHNKYTAEDFDEDLRTVLRRAGCKGEKICFIMDESNVLDSGFLERMNTLLANAEVPGLFEGDEYASLMTQCKEGAQKNGLMIDSAEELYKWFTNQVMENLHVVFTMNPPEGGLASRAATSPALFNRCVLDWFGDWSDQAFYQVGKEFTDTLDLDVGVYTPPLNFPIAYRDLPMPPSYRNAVVNAFVFVHQSLYEINLKLSKRQGRYNYVTPRHYLDFISHYVRLFHEKREDLEEQQRHLNVGLDKLRDTVIKVEELRKSLAVKKAELENKNKLANEKLQKMVADQQEAEQKKAAGLKIQEDIERQNIAIEERRTTVQGDLEKAEPAVIEAQKSVSNIKKNHLTEVRSMANPPESVRIAVESVCVLLGHKVDSWKTVQGILRRDDFISSIVNFDTNKMNTKIREDVNSTYLSNPNYNFESVNRASKACGPLVQWVIAQVTYSKILERVAPLRNELADLVKDAEKAKISAKTIQDMIQELEEKIARYKDEYAVLISETQALKTEMEKVKSRVDRSLALLANLSSEKERWESSSQSFEVQMGTIVGDVLLSAAFLAYGGYFDQQYRDALLQYWKIHLVQAGIRFKQDLSLPEYLCTADERLAWQANALPADDLCTENAIMMKRFNRYPLIIDPSGQATAFLLNEYKDKKITVTSFLDDSFLKVLESALRFGNPLLVQDVENLDPILNAVLNKELRRTGGRVLIRLGGQDIDFSPAFTLFLSTRDPSVNFPPDICSRVTFVNFTVTRSSLQSQCLHQVLKVERPDTDRKRTDLIKLQGEFQLKLRHLEKSLLQALNNSKGNILDDDNIISTLETLKQEAAEVTRKVVETDVVMKEVESVTSMYTPLAQACSSIFFIMEQLSQLHHFYQFSLDFFMEIFQHIMHNNPNLKGLTDYNQRLSILLRDLFKVSYTRASQALLHDDHITFAILLAHVMLRGSNDQIDDLDYDFFLTGGERVGAAKPANEIVDVVGEEAANRLADLARIPAFKSVAEHLAANEAEWRAFSGDLTPETRIPHCWADASSERSPVVDAFRKLILIKCVRPDRLTSAATTFVDAVFGSTFMSDPLNLRSVVLEELSSSTPVAFCSVPGFDASYKVENFAHDVSTRITSVAMGSTEGFALADNAISTAVKSGSWVLLKNVHLAPSWLGHLEKKLHSLKPHKDFRLFLTMETNPKVPVNLLRLSRVLMFEPAPGLKANLIQNLNSIPAAKLTKGPVERTRLYFVLAWLHAVVQERLRYAPLGWTKVYEFNDSEHDMALLIIDNWLEATSQGRSNISPDRIPWDAIKTLIRETVYGGKIDNEFDQTLLDSFVNKLFRPESYDVGFPLVERSEDGEALIIPEGTKLEQFVSWAQQLPEQQPPSWLGLPNNAEKVLMASKGLSMISNVRKMRSLNEEEDVVNSSGATTKASSAAQPAWMRVIISSVDEWLAMLPENLTAMIKTTESIKDPLFRFFERENKIGKKLLSSVRSDLTDLRKVCEGQLKQTNHLRALIDSVTKGVIPQHWIKFKVSKDLSLTQWMSDFNMRLAQLSHVSSKTSFSDLDVWIGGLFIPEAFITASRQSVAQRNQWSLEELELQFEFNSSSSDGLGFNISGLRLQGAIWKDNALVLSSDIATKLSGTRIRWAKTSEAASAKRRALGLPVYLNSDRTEVLFVANLPAEALSENSKVIQRSVAIIAANF
ncbi:dynein heavy chain [Polychytrium aggregatum]|uniref:dynein heavy chain n=1 Tax=Polychytrium aggregatum TaxID=110093 RepID=UPI0022FE065A|nr:dynein heavy chain [Polychytrium aggregatum]KAI9204677.1 dynein heavy chain [Polychytrium aggregatum]